MKAYIIIITIIYHFLYRILIGELVSMLDSKKDINNDSILLYEFGFEKKLYDFLKVKQWKNYMVTAKPKQFDIYSKSFADLLKSMLIAEKVHLICFFLSYIPILFISETGIVPAIVSVCIIGSLIDLAYVMIQRYNIPRIRFY